MLQTISGYSHHHLFIFVDDKLPDGVMVWIVFVFLLSRFIEVVYWGVRTTAYGGVWLDIL